MTESQLIDSNGGARLLDPLSDGRYLAPWKLKKMVFGRPECEASAQAGRM